MHAASSTGDLYSFVWDRNWGKELSSGPWNTSIEPLSHGPRPLLNFITSLISKRKWDLESNCVIQQPG